MMIPLCCEGRGGDQKRVSEWELLEASMFWGGPLGTACAYKWPIMSCFVQNCNQLTSLFRGHINGYWRTSPNTGVSCYATGVVGVWQESTQCGCSLWAAKVLRYNIIRHYTRFWTQHAVSSDDAILLCRWTPWQCNSAWIVSYNNMTKSKLTHHMFFQILPYFLLWILCCSMLLVHPL